MNIILDTHVVLWWYGKPDELKEEAFALISDKQNTIYLSAVVMWEIAIKESIGKLELPKGLMERMMKDFSELKISWQHAMALQKLPLLHGDPFDRLLIAQAQMENFALMTRDQNIIRYSVNFIEA